MESTEPLDPKRWLDDHGDILYRYALGRVRNPQTAEDLVQDTYLAAMKGYDGFAGRSSERTWLIGILKHKIIDYFRKNKRMFLSEDLETRDIQAHDTLDRKGHWTVGQSEWITNPEKAYERKEFWAQLEKCLQGLKDLHRKVYVLRELQHQEATDICEDLGISPSNLWVSLHRARLQLKDCLTAHGISRSPDA